MKKNKQSPLVKKPLSSKTLIITFISIYAAFGVLCIIFAVATSGKSFRGMLFHNGIYTDWFMDFFNSIRDSAASNVYSERNSVYPPLAVAFFRFIGRMIPYREVALDPRNKYDMQQSQLAIMFYLLYVIIVVLFMYRSVLKTTLTDKKMRISTEFFAFSMIASYPMIYCFERGNIVSAAVALTMFFVFFRNSDSKVVRELSYIALALAAGLKLYPAIFGVLLLFDKKFKDAGRLIAYGILSVVVPMILISVIPAPVQTSADMLIAQREQQAQQEAAENEDEIDNAQAVGSGQVIGDFGEVIDADELKAQQEAEKAEKATADTGNSGPQASSDVSVTKILANLFKFRNTKSPGLNFSSVSIQNIPLFCEKIYSGCQYVQNVMTNHPVLSSICSAVDGLFSFNYDGVAVAMMIICEAIAIAMLFVFKKTWQRTFLLSYLFLNIPTFSSSYALAFLTVPLIMFLFDKSAKVRTKTDVFITVLFALLFAPIPTFAAVDDEAIVFFCQAALNMSYNSKINQLIATPVFQTIFIVLVVQAVVMLVKSSKKKKTKDQPAPNAEV